MRGQDDRRRRMTPPAPRPGRRQRLAEAAIVVLARDGGRGLTHRAVDREADVPEGTAKNYFPTREDLLEAAARTMAEEHRLAVEQLHQTTPASVTAAEVRELYPALLRRAVTGDPTRTLAMFELYLEAVRRPGVRRALGEMALANATAAVHLHRHAGLPTTEADAGLLNSYFLGVAISLLALPADVRATIGLDDAAVLGHEVFTAAIPHERVPDATAGPAVREQPGGGESADSAGGADRAGGADSPGGADGAGS